MRIVVVDDEKEIADLVAAVLLADGYEVDVYYRAGEAFSAMMERPPSLAILDVMMPEMDGFMGRQMKKLWIPVCRWFGCCCGGMQVVPYFAWRDRCCQ